DPQAESTFLASKLNWAEAEKEPYAAVRRLYQALLYLRRTEPALQTAGRTSYAAKSCGESAIFLLRTAASGPAVLLLIQMREDGTLDVHNHDSQPAQHRWQTVLTTEDSPFSPDPCPPQIDVSGLAPVVGFLRPGAVILREVLNETSRKGK